MKENKEPKMKMNPMIMTAVVAVVVAGVSFFGGMKYQQSKAPAFGGGRSGANGQFAGGQGRAVGATGSRSGFRPVSGQIVNVDAKSMTVKLQDGSSKIILLSDTTTFSKSDSGSKTDLTTGATVAVFGTDNSDGSLTAQNIQLNPQMKAQGSQQASPSGTPAAMY